MYLFLIHRISFLSNWAEKNGNIFSIDIGTLYFFSIIQRVSLLNLFALGTSLKLFVGILMWKFSIFKWMKEEKCCNRYACWSHKIKPLKKSRQYTLQVLFVRDFSFTQFFLSKVCVPLTDSLVNKQSLSIFNFNIHDHWEEIKQLC